MSGRRMKRNEPDASPPPEHEDDDAAQQEDLALPIGSGWRHLRPPADEPAQDDADEADGSAGGVDAGGGPARS